MKANLLRICACLAVWLALLASGQGVSWAQEEAGAAAEPKKVNPAVAEKLVKYVIIAVDQGNMTGNYSVLRELGTPRFQATTSSARLSDAFTNLRKMKLDMSALTMLKPTFTKVPILENGQLRLVGFFPTTPIRINFSMTFGQQNGQPRISGLAITPVKTDGDATAGQSGKSSQQQ